MLYSTYRSTSVTLSELKCIVLQTFDDDLSQSFILQKETVHQSI